MNTPTDIRKGHLPLNVLLKLAWRNLWRNRKRTIITLSTIAIGFGLAVLFIGIGDGTHNSMIRNAIQLGEGHLTVQPKNYQAAPSNHEFLADGKRLSKQLNALDIDGQVAPRIVLQVLASTARNSIGAGVSGIDIEKDPRVQKIKPFLQQGHWLKPDDLRGILIGSGMARKLKAKVGSKIVLMAGKQGGDSQAQLARVRGIFHAQMPDMNDFLIISNLSFARQFLVGEGADASKDPVTRFAIFLNQPNEMSESKTKLKKAVTDPSVTVLDWREMMPQLVQFIILDDAGNYIFLSLILIMVVFGIVNTVLMSVLERTREFGLLRALGLSRGQLLLLVFCESLLLSILAVAFGWLVGGGTHLWFSHHGIDFSAMMSEGTMLMGTMMDTVVYTELSWDRVEQLTLIVFAATLTTGIYPAIKAAKVTPVEALHT